MKVTSTGGVRKFTFDVGWVFTTQVITLLMGFVLRVLLGRLIGADGLGLFTMSLMIYGLAVLVGGLGIPAAMVKFVAQYKDSREKLDPFISCALVNSLILGIVIGLILFFLSGVIANLFHMSELSSLIKIIAVALPFFLLNSTLLSGLLTGLRKMKLRGMGMACRSILMLGLAVLFVMTGRGIAGTVSAIVFAEIGTFILSVFLARKHFNFSLQNYFQTSKLLISFGAQLFLAGVIWDLNTRVDTLLVGYFLIDKDVGIYAIAIAIANVFRTIPGVVSTVTYPMMAEYHDKGNHEANELLISKIMKYMLIMLSIIGILVIFFAPDIISWLLGAEFLPAVLPLTALILGIIFFGGAAAVGSAASAAGRPDLEWKMISTSGFLVNLILDIILIPRIGINGAAIGSAASFIAVLITMMIMFKKILHFRLQGTLLTFAKIAVSLGVFFLLINVLESSLNHFVLGICAVLLYIAALFATRALTKSDIKEVYSIIRPG